MIRDACDNLRQWAGRRGAYPYHGAPASEAAAGGGAPGANACAHATGGLAAILARARWWPVSTAPGAVAGTAMVSSNSNSVFTAELAGCAGTTGPDCAAVVFSQASLNGCARKRGQQVPGQRCADRSFRSAPPAWSLLASLVGPGERRADRSKLRTEMSRLK